MAADVRLLAYNIERRYRTLSKPWLDIITELRSERGQLLGSTEYQELVGVEKAQSLNIIDQRIREAEEWLGHYEEERVVSNKTLRGRRKLIKSIATLSDDELEGKI